MSQTDQQLLDRYARQHVEDAFAELVRRHLPLVYSAALRQVRSPQLAEEIAQSAFTDLARNAAKLKPDTILTAWLYQVTRRTAIDVVRRESRRQLREQVATETNAMNASTAAWADIEPLLDEAVSALDETDRAAVLLRYFENKSLRYVGRQLGVSDDAAQKRVSRAVERLREFFAKRGVSVGASGLVAAISANAVEAAPVGLAAAISTSAAVLAATAFATTATATTAATKAIAMTTLQKALVTATVAVLTGVGIYEARQAAKLRHQIRTVQEQQAPLVQQIQELEQEREDLARQLTALRNDNERLNRSTSELLRLRGEVGRLRTALKAAEQNDKGKSESAPAQELAPNWKPPVQAYSAKTSATVPWDHAMVTGGWKLPSGRRVLVFAVPRRENEPSQLTIETGWAELSEEHITKLGLDSFLTDEEETNQAGILTSESFKALIGYLEKTDGVDLLKSPSVTTISGRQAQTSVIDLKSGPSGEQWSTGPSVDVIPTIFTDGKSVELEVSATLNLPAPPSGD